MTFNQWWATLTDKEQKLLGQHNARFVWDAAAMAEREACAKVCDIHARGWEMHPGQNPHAGFLAASNCADAIRARINND